MLIREDTRKLACTLFFPTREDREKTAVCKP